MLSGVEGEMITLDRVGGTAREYKVSKMLPATEYLEAMFSKSEIDELSSLSSLLRKVDETPEPPQKVYNIRPLPQNVEGSREPPPKSVREWYTGGVVVEKGAND
jgi:hypothetical protein